MTIDFGEHIEVIVNVRLRARLPLILLSLIYHQAFFYQVWSSNRTEPIRPKLWSTSRRHEETAIALEGVLLAIWEVAT